MRKIFSFDEKAIEGAKRGKLQPNVRARLALFHQLEEIIAEIIRAAAAPGADIFLGTEIFERLTIGDQGAGRDVSLDFEVAQKLLGERIPGVTRRHNGYSGFSMASAAGRGPGAIAILALENRRRIDRNEFVFFQNELGIEAIAPRVVNRVAAKAAVKLVFVIVIKAEI